MLHSESVTEANLEVEIWIGKARLWIPNLELRLQAKVVNQWTT